MRDANRIENTGMYVYPASPLEQDYPEIVETVDMHLNLSTTYCPREIPTTYNSEEDKLEKDLRYVHIAMIDGGADYRNFELAVELVKQHLEEDEKVLVNCDAGISRSVIVASTALSEISSDRGLRECIDVVVDILGNPCNPAPELVELAEEYVNG